MSALPILPKPEAPERKLPDYLPARMVNEFAYCPRLFFYEWVEGLFAESVDTVEGSAQHQRVDAKTDALPAAGELPETIHARSVTLSSERLRVIAKMDLVEADGETATPVDYKHGQSARRQRLGLELWPADRAQLAVQGIVLRENGYACEEGVVYYRKTGQRVRVAFDEALIAETEALIAQAWQTARGGRDSAAAGGFAEMSGMLAGGICLPDETLARAAKRGRMPKTQQLTLFGAPAAEAGAARSASADDAAD